MGDEAEVAAGLDEFLRRLGQDDEDCVNGLLIPIPRASVARAVGEPGLDARTRGLARLAALLALGAPVTSLRWGVELASAAGANDEEIVAALLTTVLAERDAQVAEGAAPLALALGYRKPPAAVSPTAGLPRARA